MAEKKKKLGKGLNSIFGEGLDDVINSIDMPVVENGGTIELNVSDIRPNPYQPRKVFADDKINELAESIREHGVSSSFWMKQQAPSIWIQKKKFLTIFLKAAQIKFAL